MVNTVLKLRMHRLVLCASFIPALLVAGCGTSDAAKISEQVKLASDAADRAERAQKAAEIAALKAGAPPATFADELPNTLDSDEENVPGNVSDGDGNTVSSQGNEPAPQPPPPPPPPPPPSEI